MTRNRRFVLFFFIGLLAWTVTAWGAAEFLVVDAPLERADAIVVLSGSSVYGERTDTAAAYYRNGVADRIVLTNDNLRGEWSSTEQRNPFFYEKARNQLLALGVPADRVEVISEPVAGTYEEALVLRKYAKSHQVRSLLVVTSAYHSRRALWTLNRVFNDTEIVIGVRGVEAGRQTPSPLTWWLQVRGWQLVAGEYAKTVYYWFVK